MKRRGNAYTIVIAISTTGDILVVRSVASLSAQLLCELRAFGEGPIWVTVGMLGIDFVVSTVGSMAALSCDLLQLVPGEVGEISWVSRSHFGGVVKGKVKFG